MSGANWLLGTLFALIVAIFILIAFSYDLGAGATYKDRMFETAAETVMALFVVAVLLERGLAVLNSLLWGDEQRRAELQVHAKKDLMSAKKALADVMGKKERLRLLLGFVIALVVSAAGIRTLQNLVVPNSATSALFNPVDILLTAALLAGGSNGLAFLIQLLKDQMTRNPPASTLRSRLVTTT